MSETFANKFCSVYFTRNLNSPAPHQAFCDDLESIVMHVITYEYVCNRLLTLDVEASMGPDGFHPKLLSSCQAVGYPFYLFFFKSLQYSQLPIQVGSNCQKLLPYTFRKKNFSRS